MGLLMWDRKESSLWIRRAYLAATLAALTTRKEKLEDPFLDLLDGLKPGPESLECVRRQILAIWGDEARLAERQKQESAGKLKALGAKKKWLLDLLLDGRIDRETYRERLDQIEQGITVTSPEYSDDVAESLDIQAAMNYTEALLGNAREMWPDCPLDLRQRIQGLIFPQKTKWDGDSFGSPVTHLFINCLQPENGCMAEMVSQEPEMWSQLTPWFKATEVFGQEAGALAVASIPDRSRRIREA